MEDERTYADANKDAGEAINQYEEMQPPSLHPLHLLDQFLEDLHVKQQEHIQRQDLNGGDNDYDYDYMAEQILSISDFLYGSKKSDGTGSGSGSGSGIGINASTGTGAATNASASATSSGTSLLDAALEILDQAPSPFHQQNHHEEGDGSASAPSSSSSPVRLIIAKHSQRKIIIVQGSSKSTSQSSSGENSANTSAGITEYMCLMGQRYHSSRTTTCNSGTATATHSSSSHLNFAMGRMGYHCSCRSFFEKMRGGDRFAVCKHLLATRLAPFLQGFCHTATSRISGSASARGGNRNSNDSISGSSSSSGGVFIYREEEVEEEEFVKIYSRLWLSSW